MAVNEISCKCHTNLFFSVKQELTVAHKDIGPCSGVLTQVSTEDAGDMDCYGLVVGVVAAAVFAEVSHVRTHPPLKGSFSSDKHRGSECNSEH